jgi:peptidoglycan/xylan/chitin deacetylase (PgdA/CDA1 family)
MPIRITITLLLFITGMTSTLSAEEAVILDLVETDRKLVALTFDDGPDTQTLELMKLIEAEGGKATFFVVGKTVAERPDILRQSAQAGHEIGNHSYTHIDLTGLGLDEVRTEIVATQDIVERLTGRRPVFFRAPFLKYDDQLTAILADERLRPVDGNLRTRDWDAATTVESLTGQIAAGLVPGSIVIMHSWPEHTLAAMPEILRTLREKGYRMVTISELVQADSR